ncbi:hypothetical protein BKA82DRAFT_4152496 [Pisolithus tinctorius]|nr:hypothetical protein BKA82DRAFT_4152496 [Pisolithus tinctorius]
MAVGEYLNALVFPSNAALMVSALVLWILAEGFRAVAPGAQGCRWQILATELLKSGYFLAAWFIQGRCDRGSFREVTTEEQALDDFVPSPEIVNHDDSPDLERRSTLTSWSPGDMRSMLIVTVTSAVYALRTFVDSRSRESADTATLYLNIPLTNLCILLILRTFLNRTFPASFWHAAVIQFSGLFILRDGLIDHIHASPWSLLLALALCNSTFFSLIDMLNRLHQSRSIYLINAIIFASSCIIVLALSAFQIFPTHECLGGLTPANVFSVVEAGKDITAIYIVHRYDAVMQGISTSLASTFLITCFALRFYQASFALLGCLLMIIACVIYLHHLWQAPEGWCETPIRKTRLAIVGLAFVFSLAYSYTISAYWIAGFSPAASWNGYRLGDIENTQLCTPKQSPSHSFSQPQGNYSHFDNILLIVFFSHARYNANLDYHKEVYSSYFPNATSILYIGPASREDAGFAHSYDVYDPWNYKMAGRMAHHMLYTALQDNECFDGYLWAPFDTLLNPFLVPLPMGSSSTLNASRHAPVANISPDPSVNLTESWRGWGLDWCDPHVGVSECMEAFNKVPLHLRESLAALTDGETRLIGGSADTMYIPGRHRKLFMEVLGLFLETNCFLEIATPTTLHLVWWIYQPPFNASFVRQKWAEGFERGSDGVWRGGYHHVNDVRNPSTGVCEPQEPSS